VDTISSVDALLKCCAPEVGVKHLLARFEPKPLDTGAIQSAVDHRADAIQITTGSGSSRMPKRSYTLV
jgi:hypothetical protein